MLRLCVSFCSCQAECTVLVLSSLLCTIFWEPESRTFLKAFVSLADLIQALFVIH